ncbi:MAG: PrsW family intramembrane metalloprotease [Rubrobacteraceae bacterium]|nr:PrsW family intramembrane metalloprotease [Rubrobacteraceae bacterium]
MSSTIAGIGVLQAVVYLLFIRAVDLYEREPLSYVVAVFVWGFTVAVFVSVVFESILQYTLGVMTSARFAHALTAVLGAPVIEECAKGAALFLVFLFSLLLARSRGEMEFSGVMDGIVYGSAVGFGFSLAEDLLYYVQFGPETFVVRRIFGGFGHAAFTSLTGVGIGLVPWVRTLPAKVALPLLGLVGAVLLHAAFNLTATLFGALAYAFLFLVVLAYLVLIILWLAFERRVIRQELYEEARTGTIDPREYPLMPTYFRRKLHYARLLSRGRFGHWRTDRRVHAAAVDLAFTKRLARRSGDPARRERVERLRERILQLRGVSVGEPEGL